MNNTIAESSQYAWGWDDVVLDPQRVFAHTYTSIHGNLSDFQFTAYGSLLVQLFFYLFFSTPGFIFQFVPAMQKYKLQKSRVLSLADQFKCFKLVFASHTGIYVPLMIGGYYATLPLGIPRDYASLPAWYTWIPKLIASLMIEDSWHYFAHRTLHHKSIYGYIHKIHHTFQSPFPMAAEYAHPIETVVLGIGFFLPMVIFGSVHLYFFWLWLGVRMLQTTEAHAGYYFPWTNPLYILPFYGGAPYHDFHHKNFTGNYGSTFTYWDWLFGTDNQYHKYLDSIQLERELQEQQQKQQQQQSLQSLEDKKNL